MSACANFQVWPDAGVPSFSKEEEARVSAFKLPGEGKRKFGSGASYYPRHPIENPSRWFADHWAKLRSLERAEGLR